MLPDLPIGHVSGNLIVVGPSASVEGRRLTPVRCVCGIERVMRRNWLATARVKSCGCLHATYAAASNWKHGAANSPEHWAWSDMKGRCARLTHKHYADYGGRGITVCPAWLESFENFAHDMGPRPSKAHSLDRKDNDGNYEPGNCRWATRTQQVRNRRVSLRVEFNGEQRLLVDLCEEHDKRYRLVYQRISKLGWTPEQAIANGIYEAVNR